MAFCALSIAISVSLLMFAASIEYICCSKVAICAEVCSSVCSCCFFRFSAALAAMIKDMSINVHKSNPSKCTRCLSGCLTGLGEKVRTYRSYLCSRSSARWHPAHPSELVNASPVSAAYRDEPVAPGWHSWGRPSSSGHSAPRTNPTSPTSCTVNLPPIYSMRPATRAPRCAQGLLEGVLMLQIRLDL
jgi:hypothetical protein